MTLQEQITRMHKLIRSTNGKFFSVAFIKRTTGKLRRMTARIGVYRYVTGEGMKFNPEDKNLFVVFDTTKRQYRMINLEGVLEIYINGKVHQFKRSKVR